MKILVIGLDCAAPDVLFTDDRLVNIRRLMEGGCYGDLESVVPPITVPAWMCMATSQDPGSLGVYGFRNRHDYSYDRLEIVDSRSIRALTIWDQIAIEGGRSVIVGVPPSYPPRKVNGISVGCFLTPDTNEVFTHPASASDAIRELVGEYPVDVRDFRTDDKERLRTNIYEMTAKHFRVVRHFLQREEWDYFQFVEIGVDRIHHGFWKHHDPTHISHDPDSPYRDVIRDYYRYVDQEIGATLELLTDDTIVLLLSDHGARPLDGGFCINEWLIREGLLVLNTHPDRVTPLSALDIDWSKTRVWAEGGYYARIFFNVSGREPHGIVDSAEFERLRDDVKSRLEATSDPTGKALGTLAFKPEEIYRDVRNIAPDLIVHFGGLAWRAIAGVGYGKLHVRENDTGPDDCNHAQLGAFILAAANTPLLGRMDGVHLLDLAPTLLDLAGYDIPPSMQGTSLAGSRGGRPPNSSDVDEGRPETSDVVRDRLRGLGYIG